MAKEQLIVFKIGNEVFGVEIGLIKEIIPYQDVTPVPDSYDFVEGIINLRGRIVTVIDMRKRLHAPVAPHEKSTRIIIMESDGRLMGLIVDSANEILRVSPDMIAPPPELISEVGAQYITGIARISERLIIMLDLRRILSAEELGRLEDLTNILYGSASQN
ncbi:MAG: chemotaxis protein CheW [Acidobacteriota bacterium]